MSGRTNERKKKKLMKIKFSIRNSFVYTKIPLTANIDDTMKTHHQNPNDISKNRENKNQQKSNFQSDNTR